VTARRGETRSVFLAGGIIVLAALAAYGNSFHGAYILDDPYSIAENPTIRHLSALRTVLSPPGGLTVSGRPVLNLSFALNYAVSGTNAWSYHALNLLIHVSAGLALFGIVRRTMVGTGGPPVRFGFGFRRSPDGRAARPYLLATLLAFGIALLWTLHPLQTESVTYIVQRTESLMGLFYLLTLYCFIRYAEAEGHVLWAVFSISACLFGMATKEVMVSAPVLAFLYDRTFLSGSFAEAWRRRWRFYLFLASTWILLGCLTASVGGNRNGTVGFGAGVSWWGYALTQFPAIATYLRLSFWPRSQMFDYGVIRIESLAQVWASALLVTALVAGTLYGLWRKPVWGFLGFGFFAILAPTSLMPGTLQMTVEHRMYLPLAAVIVAAIAGIYALIEKAGRNRRPFLFALPVLAAGLGILTARRNEAYRSEVALWQDNAAKCPGSARVQYSVGKALLKSGDFAASRDALRKALQLDPDYIDAIEALATDQYKLGQHGEAMELYRRVLVSWPGFFEARDNLGLLLAESGRQAGAVEQFRTAILVKPDYTDAHFHLANALAAEGQLAEAAAEYQQTLHYDPAHAEAHNNWGNVLVRLQRPEEAMEHFREALRLNPRYAEAHYNSGNLLFQAGHPSDAIQEYEQAIAIDPADAEAHCNLGIVLAATGHRPEAIPQYEAALAIKPAFASAHYNLANALAQGGRLADAIPHYEEALHANPADAAAHANLGNALYQMGRVPEAIAHYEEAIRLRPDDALVHYNLGNALLQTGHGAEATEQYQAALRLKPNFAEPKAMLVRIREGERSGP
jgi:tetratricopeptide (TPR) repeat protein